MQAEYLADVGDETRVGEVLFGPKVFDSELLRYHLVFFVVRCSCCIFVGEAVVTLDAANS